MKGLLPKRQGRKPETGEKTPDNQYEDQFHTLEVKMHHPQLGIKPSPSNVGDKSHWSERAGPTTGCRHRELDNWFLMPSQPRRSYQGDSNISRQLKL